MDASLHFREIRSVRDAVREFSSIIHLLQSGDLEKVGIIKGSDVMGIVLPLDDGDAITDDDPRKRYTTRDIMREMNGILSELHRGDVDEVLITQYNQPKVAIVSVSAFEARYGQ